MLARRAMSCSHQRVQLCGSITTAQVGSKLTPLCVGLAAWSAVQYLVCIKVAAADQQLACRGTSELSSPLHHGQTVRHLLGRPALAI